MFIFDRCCRSSAAVTPVKYECDINNLTGTFARSKILLKGKLTNGALVTPAPGLLYVAGRALKGFKTLIYDTNISLITGAIFPDIMHIVWQCKDRIHDRLWTHKKMSHIIGLPRTVALLVRGRYIYNLNVCILKCVIHTPFYNNGHTDFFLWNCPHLNATGPL